MSARQRKLLFMPADESLAGFYSLAGSCNKLCLVAWALEYSERYAALFEEYSGDDRVRRARDAAFFWAKGQMKMPEARRHILAAHKAASGCGNRVAEAAARAVAHAASSVHSERHAAGLVLYGLTAFALKYGRGSAEVKEETGRLTDGLARVATEKKYLLSEWAAFLQRYKE